MSNIFLMKKLLLLLLFINRITIAQDGTIFSPLHPPKEILGRKIKENLNINGRMDESAWNFTPVANDFFKQFPNPSVSFQVFVLLFFLFFSFLFFIVHFDSGNGKNSVTWSEYFYNMVDLLFNIPCVYIYMYVCMYIYYTIPFSAQSFVFTGVEKNT